MSEASDPAGARWRAVRATAFVIGVSAAASTAIGYALGAAGAGRIGAASGWPPGWWPFSAAAASGGGFIATFFGSLGLGVALGYRWGWVGTLGSTGPLLHLGSLAPAVRLGAAKFPGSSLFPLAAMWAGVVVLIMGIAVAAGAAYGARLRRLAHGSADAGRRQSEVTVHGSEEGRIG